MAISRATPKPASSGSMTVQSRILPVTPAMARQTVTETDYPWQRPLRPAKVARQKLLIATEELRIGTSIAFASCQESQKRYLVNGRHTMVALGQSERPYLLEYQEYQVETEADVAKLYDSFDQHLKRSLRDIYRTHATFRETLSAMETSHLGGAVAFLATGFRQQFRFHGEGNLDLLSHIPFKLALMESWIPEMAQVSQVLHGKVVAASTRKLLLRASVLSVALVTFRFAAAWAKRFWERAARDSGLRDGDPEWALLRYLRNTGTREVEPALYQRSVASAWNFFMSDKPVRDVTQHRARTRDPIALNRTPHDGKAHYGYLGHDGTVYQRPRSLSTDN